MYATVWQRGVVQKDRRQLQRHPIHEMFIGFVPEDYCDSESETRWSK